MGERMSLTTRRELVRAISERYTSSTQIQRGRILDEFVASTGYHRKHAIRVLAAKEKSSRSREPRLCLYDAAVRDALIVLWEASDRVCGKRLKPLVPILLDARWSGMGTFTPREWFAHDFSRSARPRSIGFSRRLDRRSTAGCVGPASRRCVALCR